MTHEDLNPFAAPASNTSTGSTTVGLRDLFKGSLNSISDGPEGALRAGLRITLVSMTVWLGCSLMRSLLLTSQMQNTMGGGPWILISAIMAVAGAGEFAGSYFLWKGSPGRRILAACYCGTLALNRLFNFLMPRLLSVSAFGLASVIVPSILGMGISVTRLLLLKQLTSLKNLRISANTAIAAVVFMMMVPIASVVWQIGLKNPLNFSASTIRRIQAVLWFSDLIIGFLEIQVAYRVLREKLTTSIHFDATFAVEDAKKTL